MKWAYSIQQKIKAAVLLAIVCVIVLVTSLLGKWQMNKLSDSFSSVYKDRLVVESYIYLIADHLYQKKLTIDHCSGFVDADLRTEVGAHNTAISQLLLSYEETLLTEEEEACLQGFKANVAALEGLEVQYLQLSPEGPEYTAVLNLINEHFDLASANLRQLSLIQIKEGKMLNDQSQRIVKGSSIITSFEMVVLICIAIILQILVLASRPVISQKWQKGSLN
ncbi:MCP four helix bundle domain-containing protein [Lewinella cohaerens]|uniref:MCP four helix bundle domain-containing protein n=1 Tax=Lewinella cohaerens TaxID=70995 RepID=UPI000361B29A|nr:MCP four helix bundle domain-containing protein [Lewinella cohaerens]